MHVCLAASLDEVAASIAAISGSNRTTVIAGDVRESAAVNAERVSREHRNREQAVVFLLPSHDATRVRRPEVIGWLTAYRASKNPEFIQCCVIDIDGGATRSL